MLDRCWLLADAFHFIKSVIDIETHAKEIRYVYGNVCSVTVMIIICCLMYQLFVALWQCWFCCLTLHICLFFCHWWLYCLIWQHVVCMSLSQVRLIGIVAKGSTSRAADPGFDSCMHHVDFSRSSQTSDWGRNNSVGSAWARCPQHHGFDPPLGTFSGRGDFSLGVNMSSNSIPQKLFRMRV